MGIELACRVYFHSRGAYPVAQLCYEGGDHEAIGVLSRFDFLQQSILPNHLIDLQLILDAY